jgi:glutathione reductase (NADPH)
VWTCYYSFEAQSFRSSSPEFDPELIAQLMKRTRDLGIELRTSAKKGRDQGDGEHHTVQVMAGSSKHLSKPISSCMPPGAEIAELNLPAARVESDPRGTKVNEYLPSVSNPPVYAAGDAADSGAWPNTSAAEYEGNLVDHGGFTEICRTNGFGSP